MCKIKLDIKVNVEELFGIKNLILRFDRCVVWVEKVVFVYVKVLVVVFCL